MSKICNNCGATLKDDAQFCTKCGTKQPQGRICPSCKRTITNANAKFCTFCGVGLEAENTQQVSTPQSQQPPQSTSQTSTQQQQQYTVESDTKKVVESPNEQPSSTKKKTIIISSIAAAVILTIIFVLIFTLPNRESSSTASIQNSETEEFVVNGVRFKMVYVQGGTFFMGATAEQGAEAYKNELPVHSVTLSDYYIGQTEVTQQLWKAVMGVYLYEQHNIANAKEPICELGIGPNSPMYYISWYDCQEFIHKLNQLTGKHFSLPTEAQWEFAARGGNKSCGYKYSGSNSVSEVAWWHNNSDSIAHTVAKKRPNELGIYDMSGNVWEWCSDWYGDYSSDDQINPQGVASGSYRILRRGCWFDDAKHCRVSRRCGDRPDSRGKPFGMRLVLIAK